MALVTGGTALGQVVTIAASPILARLFTPADFGMLAVYASLTGSVAAVGALTYQQAIALPEEDAEAANVLALALGCMFGASALAALVLLVLSDFFSGWERTAALAHLLWLVPLGCLGLGCFEAVSQWALRTKEFGAVARANVTKNLAQAAVQIGGGALGSGALGLFVGQLVGQWSGTFGILRLAWRKQRAAIGAISRARVWAAAKRYRRFPALTLPAVVLNAVSFYAPALLLAYFFGGAVAGFYTVQDRVTAIPLRFVGASAQRVFLASAAEAKREERLAPFTQQVFAQLLRVGLPFVALLAASAPSLFSVVFGAAWSEAGYYAQWLCISAGFAMIVFPLTPLNYVQETQWAETGFQVILLVTRVGSIIAGGLLGSARLAITMTGVSVGAAWLVYLVFLLRLSGSRVLSVLRGAAKEIAIAAAVAAPLVVLRLLSFGDVTITVSAALLGVVAGILVLGRRAHRNDGEVRKD